MMYDVSAVTRGYCYVNWIFVFNDQNQSQTIFWEVQSDRVFEPNITLDERRMR